MSEIQLPEAFLKLGEVLEQGQFELLFTEEIPTTHLSRKHLPQV